MRFKQYLTKKHPERWKKVIVQINYIKLISEHKILNIHNEWVKQKKKFKQFNLGLLIMYIFLNMFHQFYVHMVKQILYNRFNYK